MTKKNTVLYERKKILAIIGDLETIRCSLDRIGSCAEDVSKANLARMAWEFLVDWDVFGRVTAASRELKRAFDDSELEDRSGHIPIWDVSSPKPPVKKG